MALYVWFLFLSLSRYFLSSRVYSSNAKSCVNRYICYIIRSSLSNPIIVSYFYHNVYHNVFYIFVFINAINIWVIPREIYPPNFFCVKFFFISFFVEKYLIRISLFQSIFENYWIQKSDCLNFFCNCKSIRRKNLKTSSNTCLILDFKIKCTEKLFH